MILQQRRVRQLRKYANGVGSSLILDTNADSAPAVKARENVVTDQQYQEAMDVVNRYHRQIAIPEQANIVTKYHWLCALFGPDPINALQSVLL